MVSFSLTMGSAPSSSSPVEGVLEVFLPILVLQVLAGEQDQGHHMAVLGEELVIGVHQFTLAHGGGSLLARHITGPAGQGQLAHPHTDGPGGDQNDLMTGIFQVTEHLAQLFHLADIQPAGGIGQGGGAHFDDNSHGCLRSSLSRAPQDTVFFVHCLPRSSVFW